jgi:hypothetical protein
LPAQSRRGRAPARSTRRSSPRTAA